MAHCKKKKKIIKLCNNNNLFLFGICFGNREANTSKGDKPINLSR